MVRKTIYTFRILSFFLFFLTNVFQSVLIWSQDEESMRASSIYNTLDNGGHGKNKAALLMAEAIATHIAILSTQKH